MSLSLRHWPLMSPPFNHDLLRKQHQQYIITALIIHQGSGSCFVYPFQTQGPRPVKDVETRLRRSAEMIGSSLARAQFCDGFCRYRGPGLGLFLYPPIVVPCRKCPSNETRPRNRPTVDIPAIETRSRFSPGSQHPCGQEVISNGW
jgi:hypothetical protein